MAPVSVYKNIYKIIIDNRNCKYNPATPPRDNNTSLIHKIEQELHPGDCGLLSQILQKKSRRYPPPQFYLSAFVQLLLKKKDLM